MCIALPGEVISIKDNMAKVDILGIKRSVVLEHLKGVRKGDHVLVFRDFAIERLTKRKADQLAKDIKDV
jgi:hydrogenase expression/formation protein HypC